MFAVVIRKVGKDGTEEGAVGSECFIYVCLYVCMYVSYMYMYMYVCY